MIPAPLNNAFKFLLTKGQQIDMIWTWQGLLMEGHLSLLLMSTKASVIKLVIKSSIV